MSELPSVLLVLPSKRDIQALKELISGAVNVVGEATGVREAERLLVRFRPKLVVAATTLSDGSAFNLQNSMKGTSTKIILLGQDPSPEDFRLALQAGVADLIPLPVTPGDILEAIRRASGDGDEGPKGRLITVFSSKGGVGKTTVAANLAAELAAAQRTVFLLDLDLEFGNLATFFGAVPRASVADLARLTGPITLSAIREAATIDPVLGLPILTSPPTPDLAATIEGDAKKEPGRNYVQEILKVLAAAYDDVIVDTSPRFSEATVVALEEADRVIVVTSPDIPSLHSTAKGLEVLVQRLGFPKEKITLVLNRANSAIGLTAEDMGRFLDRPIDHRLPSDGDTAVRACNTGVPLVRKRGRSPLARALRTLARDVGQEGPAAPVLTRTERRSLIGR